MVFPAIRVHRDHEETQVLRAKLAYKVSAAPPVTRDLKGKWGQSVRKEKLVWLGPQVPRVQMAQPVQQVYQDHVEHQVSMDSPEMTVLTEKLVTLAQPVKVEVLEFREDKDEGVVQDLKDHVV